MTTDRKKFGEILVSNGTISEKTLQRALDKAKQHQVRIGTILEEMGVATGDEIAATLAEQFSCKMVRNFAGYLYPADLLKLVPADLAMRNLLFPLKMEQKRLYLAMADPTDTRIAANLAVNHGLTIVPCIAPRRDIVAAINKHYLGKEATADSRQTVLIVEDNTATGAQLARVLAQEGFRVVGAVDGIEAFRKAITEAPDVIVTDKEMPLFDGYKLLEALRALPETRRIPVLMITASLNSDEESEAFRKGFFDFLAKPVKDVTLVTRVKRALQAGAGAEFGPRKPLAASGV